MSERSSEQKKLKRRRYAAVLLLIFVLLLASVAVASAIMTEYYSKESESSFSDSFLEDESAPAELSSSESQPESLLSSSQESSSSVSLPVSETAPVDDSYFDDAVFVGDSLMSGFGSYGVVSMENVFADVGINLDTIMTKACISTPNGASTIPDALALKQPAKIYIMLGSNGIAWISPEQLAQKYSDFLDVVLAQNENAEIYIASIPPVTAAKQAEDARYDNSAIDAYNQYLLELAEEKGVYFVDVHAFLSDESGTLSAEYAEKDGMHLKKAGYDALFDYLKAHTVPKQNTSVEETEESL